MSLHIFANLLSSCNAKSNSIWRILEMISLCLANTAGQWILTLWSLKFFYSNWLITITKKSLFAAFLQYLASQQGQFFHWGFTGKNVNTPLILHWPAPMECHLLQILPETISDTSTYVSLSLHIISGKMVVASTMTSLIWPLNCDAQNILPPLAWWG